MRTRPGSSSRLGALFRLRLREASCFGARGARAGWPALLRSVRPFPVLALPAAFCAGRAGRSVRSVRPPRAGRLALPGWALRRLWLFGAFWVFSPLALPAGAAVFAAGWAAGALGFLAGRSGVASGALTKWGSNLGWALLPRFGAALLPSRRGRLLLERRFSLRPPGVRFWFSSMDGSSFG